MRKLEYLKTTSLPGRKSEDVRQLLEKLLKCLSDVIFQGDREIVKVLMQGAYIVRKLNSWVMEARTLESQASHLFVDKWKKEGGWSRELIDTGIKIANHLKRCPFMDDRQPRSPIMEVRLSKISAQEPSSTVLGKKLPCESQDERVPLTQMETKQSHHLQDDTLVEEKTGQDIELAISSDEISQSHQVEDRYDPEIRQHEECTVDTIQEMDNLPSTEIFVVVKLSKFVNVQLDVTHSSWDEAYPNTDFSLLNLDPEKDGYSFLLKNKHTGQELDPKGLSVKDKPSTSHPKPPQNILLSEKEDHPNLVFLCLQRNSSLNHSSSTFFDRMPALQFLDLSSTRIRTFPRSIFNLKKLKVLLLRNCLCLDRLPPEIRELNSMEVFDLSGTELYDLPDEIGELTKLRLLHLSFYGPDDETEYFNLRQKLCSERIFSKLLELEALSISVHPEDHRWKKIAKEIMLDVCRLNKLNHLKFYFPEIDHFLEFIKRKPKWFELKSFKFVVGRDKKRIISRVPDDVELKYAEQEKCLRLVNDDKIPENIETILHHVNAFYLDHHVTVRSLSEIGISNSKELKFVVLRECPMFKVIVGKKNCGSVFESLEYLGIHYMWKLGRICKFSLPSGSFHRLKYLSVHTCPKLKYILRVSMAQCLSSLEDFVVEDCESVKTIVGGKKKTCKDDLNFLPRLRKLELRYLPELKTLGHGLREAEEKVSYSGCPKLKLNMRPRKLSGFACCGCIRL